MKIFISWSGDLSKRVAKHLGNWIEDTLQGVKTWVSTEDIDKGRFWFSDITDTLADSNYGILCLTPENLHSPWILFEAGALSKGLTKNKVCPLLINLTPSQLIQPLSNLNAAMTTKEDMLKLILSINNEQGDKKIGDERIGKTFEIWWDSFENGLKNILQETDKISEAPKKTSSDILEEILESTKSLQRSILNQPTSDEIVGLIYNIFTNISRTRSDSFGKSASSYLHSKQILDDNKYNIVGGKDIEMNLNSAKSYSEKLREGGISI